MKKADKTVNKDSQTTPEAAKPAFKSIFRKKDKTLPPDPSNPERRGRKKGSVGVRKLTVAQKAEIAALYNSGTCSVADLAKQFDKAPSTITLVIKTMGIKKGGGVEEATRKITEQIEQRALTDLEVVMQKIVKAKEEFYVMNNALAKMVWNEIRQEKSKESPDLGRLKDAMTTLKIASDLIGNSRKEVYALLNVERFDEERSHDELPELTVRELTGTEIKQLQLQSNDDDDLGGSMMPEDSAEKF